jgi:carnitine O-acetyltransferase
VELFQPDSNTLLGPQQIYRQLEDVIKMSPEGSTPPVSERVGLLTTNDRDTWTKAYQNLAANDINAQSLKSIQQSVGIICLDQQNPDIGSVQDSSFFTQSTMTTICGRGLHGNGVARNSGNRWFDKPMQMYFGSDGGSGAILEHSVCDGILAIDFLDTLLDYCNSLEAMSWTTDDTQTESSPQPKKLTWNLSNQTRLDILEAAEKIDRLVDDTDLSVFVFKHFGKEFIKSTKHSPDAFIQVCIQLAYYRLYGKMVPTYESASTSQFELGRTETIRSATPEAAAFSYNMDRADISNEEKVRLVRDAIAAHVKYTKEASAGQGIDRHLLGLKLAAREAGLPTPKLFTDPSFGKVFSFKLSTSQVPSTYELVLCFGAVEPDGYGICYNPRQNAVSFAVSSFRSCLHTDSGRMAAALERALLDLQTLLSVAVQSKL